MDVYLIDGTYELFRHFFAVPSAKDGDGHEIGAVSGVLGSVLGMIESGVTHLGVATDHVIESFRNRLYKNYKTGERIDPALASQFVRLEIALRAMGVLVWAMEEQEADDALAAAAKRAAEDPRVDRIVICTPDKDLAQCVVGRRIVQLDRRRQTIRDEAGVRERFGVAPGSIPDYLALIGDAADGFPGIKGWGSKSAQTVLARYPHLEAIPRNAEDWEVQVSHASRLAETLLADWDDALLFRDLATLRTDHEVFQSVDELQWKGPLSIFQRLCTYMHSEDLWNRAAASSGSLKQMSRSEELAQISAGQVTVSDHFGPEFTEEAETFGAEHPPEATPTEDTDIPDGDTMKRKRTKKVIATLNKILEMELAGAIHYTHYSFMVFGYNRIPIVGWMERQATESMEHARAAGELVTQLGGHPSLAIGPLLETHQHEIGAILRESLGHEKATLKYYDRLLDLVEDHDVMLEEYAREHIALEVQHVGEVDKMLRTPGDIAPFKIEEDLDADEA